VLGSLGHSLQQLILPQSCLVCHALLLKGMRHICLPCQELLPEIGKYVSNNDTESSLLGRFPTAWAYSWLYFQEGNITQKMMSELKYRGNKDVGIYMGQQLALKILEQKLDIHNAILIPVPLNDKRLIKRGYNQAAIIAEAMSVVLNIPCAGNGVLRIRNTSTQTAKNREERQFNMQAAFEINKSYSIEQKLIILVDDVMTTGATLDSCAQVLLQLPGVTFAVATVAKTLK
jgi:ComF family protein